MNVSEFAVAMYGCEVVKDRVMVHDSNNDMKLLYDGRMEFLRYAHELDQGMAFTNREVLSVSMLATYTPMPDECVGDYRTIITV